MQTATCCFLIKVSIDIDVSGEYQQQTKTRDQVDYHTKHSLSPNIDVDYHIMRSLASKMYDLALSVGILNEPGRSTSTCCVLQTGYWQAETTLKCTNTSHRAALVLVVRCLPVFGWTLRNPPISNQNENCISKLHLYSSVIYYMIYITAHS
ncbi:unnamed protein product [Amoebophrya sp. A25]|nr:unnamed protein product [Amoebophrya sp. A25]|eukprot:GSA25T00010986001.1